MSDDTLNMLTLYTRIKDEPKVQGLAAQLRQGFSRVIWDTLVEFKVLDARITALPRPDGKPGFDALLLCTTFQMPNLEYQTVFFGRFPATFVRLALASVEPPFDRSALSEQQQHAVDVGDEQGTEADREALQPLFEPVRQWIDAHDLTLGVKPLEQPEPERRNQFHLRASGTSRWSSPQRW